MRENKGTEASLHFLPEWVGSKNAFKQEVETVRKEGRKSGKRKQPLRASYHYGPL
jgi:hypothetical protein